MANPGLIFTLTAESAAFEREIASASQTVNRELGRMNQQAQAFDQNLTRASRGGLRSFTGVAQQAGFQIGDFAVQVASGQSAIIALTQQGSQLAGAFGPVGAVLGAAGAVVGALAVAFSGASDEAGDLTDKADGLNAAISNLRGAAVTGGDGVATLIEQYGELDAQLIQLIQRQTQLNLLLAQTALREQLSGLVTDAGQKFDSPLIATPTFDNGLNIAAIQQIQDTLGVSRDKAVELERSLRGLAGAEGIAAQAEAANRLGDAISEAVTDTANPALVDFASTINQTLLQVREFEQANREMAAGAELVSRPLNELNRLAAESGNGGSGGGNADAGGSFSKLLRDAEERIAAFERERAAVGMTADAIARLNIEYEAQQLELKLLAAARATGAGVTEAEAELVRLTADAYRDSAIAVLDAAAAQDAMAKAQRAAAASAEKARSDMAAFTNQIFGAIDASNSLEENLRNVGLQLANLVAQGLLGGGPLGGALGSLFSGAGGGIDKPVLASGGLYADGAAFRGGRVTPFANGGVISSPTLFPMSGGRTGMMAENDPEAIMPLKRGPDGKLGVAASGGGGHTIYVDARYSRDPAETEAAARRGAAMALAQVPGVTRDLRRRGAL